MFPRPIARGLAALCAVLAFTHLSFAQEEFKLKWGQIPPEDLAMTAYAADPDAAAVVLDETGSMRVEPGGQVVQTMLDIHRRVKVLQPAGLSFGDIEVGYHKAGGDAVRGLRAMVTNPDGTSSELKKKDFFKEERENGAEVLKAALPNVQVGSVIELSYTYVTEAFTLLPKWRFQEEIPVRRSLLRYRMPTGLDYIYLWRGTEHMAPTNVSNTDFAAASGAKLYKRNGYFLMENLPALSEEPYISTMDDYYAQVSFQLNSYLKSGISTPFLTTWEKVAERLLNEEGLGLQYIDKYRYNTLAKDARPSIAAADTPSEKVAAAYRFVADNVLDNGESGYFVESSLDNLYKDRRASPSGMNLMLIALLRDHDIEADPVLVSTRSHGKPYPYYPMLAQFNGLIVRAVVDGKPIFLDVGERTNRPPGLVRRNVLNGQGWLLQRTPEWIELPARVEKETVVVNCALAADGTVEGDLFARFNGFVAQRHHRQYEAEKARSTWTERMVGHFDEVEIPTFECTDKTKQQNRFETKLTFTAAPQGAGSDFMYLSPVLYGTYAENPFELEKRYFAVDMATPFLDKYVYSLAVPEGYLVEDLPESVKFNLPNDGGYFTYLIAQKGDTIKLTCIVSMKQTLWSPDEYATIRNFFNLIAEKQGEQIVLKKA